MGIILLDDATQESQYAGYVTPLDDADRQFVRELVHRHCAIQLDESKGSFIDLHLARLARERGYTDAAQLVSWARAGDRRVTVQIAEALMPHETSFFRDGRPFEALESLLPKLAAARASQRQLNIWCAACSSGQEPYSIAMLLLERFPELAAWPARILATDLSAQMLARAREASFSALEIERGLPQELRTRYFELSRSVWQLRPPVRELVEFRQLNLSGDWNVAPRPDIVFLRNVLIYFDSAMRLKILDRIRESIAPDGALFLGAAEGLMQTADGWQRVATDTHTYYTPCPAP